MAKNPKISQAAAQMMGGVGNRTKPDPSCMGGTNKKVTVKKGGKGKC